MWQGEDCDGSEIWLDVSKVLAVQHDPHFYVIGQPDCKGAWWITMDCGHRFPVWDRPVWILDAKQSRKSEDQ
jgi:hypothetical protein